MRPKLEILSSKETNQLPKKMAFLSFRLSDGIKY